jgi:uncharacterized membrane protein YgdD (TMEM256/DUF423 family)
MTGMTWLRLGAILGGLAVGSGAFGAHALASFLERSGDLSVPPRGNPRDAKTLATFETGARYQMYHALALVAVGLLAGRGATSGALAVAGWSFFLGIVLFSGSLYALALTGIKWLGAITPFGGVLFLVGWAALAVHRAAPAKTGPVPEV